jgi:hypothetical protein
MSSRRWTERIKAGLLSSNFFSSSYHQISANRKGGEGLINHTSKNNK